MVLLAVSAVIVSVSEFDHSVGERVLQQHVIALGKVNYAAFKATPSELDAHSRAHPMRSVRDLGMTLGFFRGKEHKLGGTAISLHALEDDVLRPAARIPGFISPSSARRPRARCLAAMPSKERLSMRISIG